MINIKSHKLCKVILIIFILLMPNYNSAEEILIYADSISYDEQRNIVAKGNAKIFNDNQFIMSDLIIYNQKEKKIILPTIFTLKDKDNNYLSASDGFFNQNLDYGEFNNIKIKLNDGSRIIGKKGKRDGSVDIISKAVYSPCKSRIKVANFICPTWQLEAEKILHDNENLFLYQKHSKMRVINTPVFYIPYIVTPSPLRKERKTGFLAPKLSFNFFDTKTTQSTSFPYYYNLAIDKELTFTPIFNYGGGIDSSQRFVFDYNQIISGGYFSSDLTFDSNLENQNNNKWFSDASLITNYKKNINEKYKITIDSALQTSQNYIQITDPDNELSYKNSLSTNIRLEGYNINKVDDYLETNFNFYQTNQINEDNKTTPTVLPYIIYNTGNTNYYNNNVTNTYEFYNIFRDKNTDIHAQRQQKLSHKLNSSINYIKYNSKFTLSSEIYNQIFNTENKLIQSNDYHSGSLYRFFPILSISSESPFNFLNDKYGLTYNPKLQLVISPGKSNSNKLSNEDSTNNNYSLLNSTQLNRFNGTDKIDNSKRLNFGFDIYNNKLKLNLSQTYEFTDNSNYHNEQGNDDNLSDLLGSLNYSNTNELNYNFRYDVDDDFLKEQNIIMKSFNKLGQLSFSYLNQKKKTNNIIKQDLETVNYSLKSNNFLKFSNINVSGLYDLKKEINTEYSIGYSYFDECFGVNLDFNRKSYEEENLKPQDIFTVMFSFKNIGSYRSSNLAVSEADKLDIDWESNQISNDNRFYEYK